MADSYLVFVDQGTIARIHLEVFKRIAFLKSSSSKLGVDMPIT